MSNAWENVVSRLAVTFTEQVVEVVLGASLEQLFEELNEEDATAKGGLRNVSNSSTSNDGGTRSPGAWAAHRHAVEASLAKHAGNVSAAEALRQAVEASLSRHHGNVSAVAREMGKGRTQVRRWIERFQLDGVASGSLEERQDAAEPEHESMSATVRAMDRKRRRARQMLERLGYL